MLRSCRSCSVVGALWLLGGFGTGCFGKVEYDVLPSDVAPPPGAASGGSLAPPPSSPGSGGDGPSGGTNAGFPPREPPVVEPPRPPAACSVDCCPDRLLQLTGAFPAGPLDADVERPYLSGDGTWVAFSSRATVAPGAPTLGVRQVYLRALTEEATTLRVGPADGSAGDGDSEANAISSDGRWVLVTSNAENWAGSSENGSSDVFLFDRAAGELVLVSRAPDGSTGNGASLGRDLSPDGRFVAFSSVASDLVDGDDNDGWDVFVWDRQSRVTARVSMGPGDQQRNPVSGNHAHVSGDGRFVSFHSQSDLLTAESGVGSFDVFFADREVGITTKISRALAGGPTDGNTFVLGMSDDGRFLASYGSASNLVEGDTNGRSDVFLFDRVQGSVQRVNVGPAGEEADSGSTHVALSHDGRRLTFASASTRLSADGDGVALQSYVYDVQRGGLARLSETQLGGPADAHAYAAEFSASGRCFVFTSFATNLGPSSVGDGVADLFVGRWSPQH